MAFSRYTDASPNAAPVEAYVSSLLRANPTGHIEAYRPILQLTAAAASAQIASDDLHSIGSFPEDDHERKPSERQSVPAKLI